MNLSELKNGDIGVITKVKGHGAFRKRITEMGFVKGKKVTVIKNAPLKDPIEYSILDYKISLRRNEAKLIEVVTIQEAQDLFDNSFKGIITDDILKQSATKKHKIINIVLVGNPNSGKTTLFNYASGSKEHVGNYGGVTINSKAATFYHKDYLFNIIDLPGTYSISAYSPEETFVREYITNETPDIVVNVLDSSNLERNLYLTTQLIDLDIKVVVALNMYDEMQKRGDKFDYEQLGGMLGIPFIPTVGSKGKGVSKLFDKLIDVYEDKDPIVRHIHINYDELLENAIEKLDNLFSGIGDIANKISPRYLAIKSLEKDHQLIEYMADNSLYEDVIAELEKQTHKIEHQSKEDTETLFTDSRYGFVAGALKETYKESPRDRRRLTESIDSIITHKLFGFPVFIFFMWVMFQSTFSLGEYPMNWIEQGVAYLSNFISTVMPAGSFKDLVINGIIGGVGGVIVFLPNILILFFFISLMEDTGYMARAAFIMDKIMHKMGLHGKSFIPLVMGFGCNVPAIMATRTIENKNNRILTMLINPLMSCSARLPVYILIIGAFFPENAGTVLFSVYGIGILLAVLVARLLKRLIFKHNEIPFVMELPPYRVPTLKNTLRHMWHKGAEYLKKMGGIILIASIIIWFLSYYPKDTSLDNSYDKQIEQITSEYNGLINEASEENRETLNKQLKFKTDSIASVKHSIQQENTYIGRLGKAIEPVIKPLGFDGKMGISLITGIAAKEIVISTMAVIYNTDDINDSDGSTQLISRLKQEKYPDGTPVFTKATALGFMIFILIYFPCIAVIAAIKKESGSWKWAIFTIFYTTSLAWLLAYIVNQTSKLLF